MSSWNVTIIKSEPKRIGISMGVKKLQFIMKIRNELLIVYKSGNSTSAERIIITNPAAVVNSFLHMAS